MNLLTKDGPEYLNNGHYKIDGQDFMSVWTFKNTHKLFEKSKSLEKSKNLIEGGELFTRCSVKYKSKPEIGNYDSVYIYPVSELEDYYGI